MNKLFYALIFLLGAQLATAQNVDVPVIQNSLVTKHTATWCTFCGRTAWDVYAELIEDVEQGAIFLASHRDSGSDLYSEAGEDLLTNLPGVVYQPEFFVNEEKMTGDASTLAENIKNQILENTMVEPLAQSGIELYINEDGSGPLTVSTNTKFFDNTSGTYHLAVWMLQKEVIANQAGRSEASVHKKVLKKALTEETFGIEIASGSTSESTEIQQSFEYAFEEGEEPENLEIVLSIWKKEEDRFTYVNSISSSEFWARSVTNVSQLEGLLQSFSVMPNLISDEAMVEVQLSSKVEDVELGLYNLYGQLVQPVFSGNLQAGVNRFSLEVLNQSSGMYVLNLRSREGVVSKKVIIR